MKKIGTLKSLLLSIAMLLLSAMMIFSACSVGDVDIGVKKTTLSAPTAVRIEGNSLCWNPVEFASKYTVSIDGRENYAEDYTYPIEGLSDGEHVFKVKANGDGILYETSAWSEEYVAIIEEGRKASAGAYSQFDDLTKKESFLGYGFDVINSSVFSDKYVKTSTPLFKTEELMKQRLVKVDSKSSVVMEVSSSSMEDFMQQWNASANVDVSWGKKRIGGSVNVEAVYSGGSETAKSKYFHSISITNQKFYIVMQSDMATYRDILSDGFKKDLYSDMEPAELFRLYGTHFITSAVMGGKINSYYLYTSDEERSFHDISTKVSTEVRYWVGKTSVTVEGGYRQEAEKQNIYIKNVLETIGGGDFAMSSDQDIGVNYLDWEKSLNEHPSLIGIKDTGSLRSIWDLIDPALDTKSYSWDYDGDGQYEKGSRSQQLQAYFAQYGIESYNSLMSAADLPGILVPEDIDKIRINGKESVNGYYEVYAGAGNDISFAVLPSNATGYTKAATLSTATELASISDEKGLQIVISPMAKNGQTFDVIVSAGSVRKTIKIRVVRRYMVTFVSSPGSIVDPISNILHGANIEKPNNPTRKGYKFIGWYIDEARTQAFDFDATPIVEDLTLYAKWEPINYTVTFVTSPGSVINPLTDILQGTYIEKPADPTRGSYKFVGWYTDEETTQMFDFEATPITQNLTLYAKWLPIEYNITFITSPGSEIDPILNVLHGTYVKPPQEPTREWYDFNGWYTDEARTQKFDFDATPIVEDLTLYAKWERKAQFCYEGDTKTLIIDLLNNQAGEKVFQTDYPEYNDGVLTIDSIFLDKEVKNVEITGTGCYTDNSGLNADLLPTLTIKFDKNWNSDINLTLKNMGFSAKEGMPALDLSDVNGAYNVTIKLEGRNCLYGSSATGETDPTPAIVGNNITIKSDSSAATLYCVGGNGGDATVAGGKGQDGAAAIQVRTLVIDVEGGLDALGGNGGKGGIGLNGQDGANGANRGTGHERGGDGANGGTGGKGGEGGSGAAAIVASNLTLNSKITATSGNGGEGGKGGTGGRGGNGGEGGSDYNFFNTSAGRGGDGGYGGYGGKGGTAYTGIGGLGSSVVQTVAGSGTSHADEQGEVGFGVGAKMTYNGHDYYLFTGKRDWTNAKDFAESLGGHLATVTSQGENDALVNMLNEAGYQNVWLGATDEEKEGEWKWITGEPWDYTNWCEGQPDNYNGVEHYLSLDCLFNGQWNDSEIVLYNHNGTATMLGFIIEFEYELA